MKKYFLLQCKRSLKFLPFVLAVTLILAIGLSAALTGIIGFFNNKEDKQLVNIAISGDTDNQYLSWGMSALQNLDETRYSINIITLTEEKAREALLNGDITAYAVFPEDFIEKALQGNMEPVRYVTTSGVNDIVALFQNELTQIITKIMVYSEKGAYGIVDAIYESGTNKNVWEYSTLLSIEYVDLIIHRSDIFKIQELGFSAGLGLANYFICGITVLLLGLSGLPYAIIQVKKDTSLRKLMISRGHSGFSQLLCEFAAHLCAMVLLTAFILATISLCSQFIKEISANIISTDFIADFAKLLFPVLIMLSAFNIMIFEFADNIISAVLMHFFTSLGLCYITGCLYPIFTFPVAIQKISGFLPMGIAREYLASAFTGVHNNLCLIGLIAYSVLFFMAAFLVCTRKITHKQGG